MRSSRSAPPDWLTAAPYAHRGLHGPDCPENSRAAFAAALAIGHGVELDVRLSSDGEAIVFHDDGLERLTGAKGRVAALTAAELGQIRLGNGETIPLLNEILELIAGRAPILIELKAPRGAASRLCRAVERALSSYRGQAAIMSFNPWVSASFAGRTARPRGLVVSARDKKRIVRLAALLLARPDFVARDVRDLPLRRRHRLPLLTWTVRTPAEAALAERHADQIIHELPQ